MTDVPSPLAPVIVDNRLRQRRIDVARDTGRRRLHRLLAIAAVALLAVLVAVTVDSALLDIDEITISGAGHTTADELLTAAGVDLGDALVTLDLAAVERRLEAVPWVDAAAVERDLPGSLSISITERAPATIITAGGSAALVDDDGRVLSIGPTTTLTSEFAAAVPDGGAPVAVRAASLDDLVAGRPVSGRVAVATDLAARVAEDPAGVVAAVVADETGIVFELSRGGTVVLGDPVDLDQKVEAFRTMVGRVDLQCLATLDLRTAIRPVLTRDAACS